MIRARRVPEHCLWSYFPLSGQQLQIQLRNCHAALKKLHAAPIVRAAIIAQAAHEDRRAQSLIFAGDVRVVQFPKAFPARPKLYS